MKGIKTIIAGVLFVGIIAGLASFSGVFGYWYSDDQSRLIGFVTEDGTFLDLDGNPLPEEEAEIRMEETSAWLDAYAPRFDITVAEINEVFDSLESPNDFEISMSNIIDGNVGVITVGIASENPLSDLQLMAEFEQLITSILEKLDIDYPRVAIEQMMTKVIETEVTVDQIQYTDTIGFVFAESSSIGLASETPLREGFEFSIFAK